MPSGSSQSQLAAVAPGNHGQKALEDLAHTPSDMPAGCKLQEHARRLQSDMSALALDLGWYEGYIVKYVCLSDESLTSFMITQSVTWYPEKVS